VSAILIDLGNLLQAATESISSSRMEDSESNKEIVIHLKFNLRMLLDIIGRKLVSRQQRVTFVSTNLEVVLWKLAGKDFTDCETKNQYFSVASILRCMCACICVCAVQLCTTSPCTQSRVQIGSLNGFVTKKHVMSVNCNC
jgi:hypothetical protein